MLILDYIIYENLVGGLDCGGAVCRVREGGSAGVGIGCPFGLSSGIYERCGAIPASVPMAPLQSEFAFWNSSLFGMDGNDWLDYDWMRSRGGSSMQKGLSWYAILLKENLKKRTTWLAAAAMLFLLYIVSGIHLPETDNVSVGLCAGQNVQDYEFLTELQSESVRFRYMEYADEERLYQDVQSGKLECAFLLDERFEQKVEAGSLKDCVYYISNPHTTKGEVAKEAFFAAFFRSYSKKLLEKSEREIFTEHSSSRLKAMEMENEKFLQSDFISGDTSCSISTTSMRKKSLCKCKAV